MSSSPEFEEKKERPLGPEAPKPLETSLRGDMEHALDVELGGVRIHADEAACHAADRLGARAFTHRQEIYFAREEYRPDTLEDRELLAHELAHTVQQDKTQGEAAGRKSLEAEAEHAADAVRSGAPKAVRLRAPAGGIQKQEKAKPAAPSVQKHADEITPAPVQGTVSGGGFTIAYLYNLSRESSHIPLTLQITEGVSVVATPLTDMAEGSDYRVQNAGGSKATAVVVTVGKHVKAIAKIQLTFTRGSASYIVVFQFPGGAAKG